MSHEMEIFLLKNHNPTLPILYLLWTLTGKGGIVENKLTYNREFGIALRKKESSRYKLRWEIERTFSIFKEIHEMEYIWYVKHRNYGASIGEIIVAYNCIVMADKIVGISERKIMYIVS